MHRVAVILLFLGPLVETMLSPARAAAAVSAEDIAYFEQHIRPVLVDSCYECHGGDPEKIKGGLNLTYRDGMITGGSGGAVLAAENPAQSRLLTALRYEHDDLRMPPAGKLSDDVIAHFEAWIRMGAPDPRDSPPSAEVLGQTMSWEAVRERRMAWWSFQPIRNPELPGGVPEAWSKNPVDMFIWSKLDEAGLPAAELADPYALVRRLYFVLTGLPPTPEQVGTFVANAAVDHDGTVSMLVEDLLDTPAFGERWGRHWMDWIRYAESHGSEGDPAIPQAWRYRDYIIAALNADVPYDDLVREHLAGDLIQQPRIDENGVNASMIGTAQYRFVLHGFSPTDALDERVRFTDNQIDVVSKAFLGLTVSCARCHDHKFDPISQKDFYALYGIMTSCRPATVTVDTTERQNLNKSSIDETKAALRGVLAEQWLQSIEGIADAMRGDDGPWARAVANATTNQDPLHAWQRLRFADPHAVEQGWRELEAQWNGSSTNLKHRAEAGYPEYWNLGGDGAAAWGYHGSGVNGAPVAAGAFDVRESGDQIIGRIYPAGIYSHLYSTKHSAVLASPRFNLKDRQVFVRIAGDGDAVQRYVVQDYPRSGTIYPIAKLGGGNWRWQRWDVAYWNGDSMHLELSTANDQAVLSGSDPQRSWFGITEAMVVADGQPAPRDEMAEFVAPLFMQEGTPKNRDEVAARYQAALRQCVSAWRDGTMNDGQARFLTFFVEHGLLPNTAGQVPGAGPLLDAYRQLESAIPYPTRAPGILEGAPVDQPLFARGDHKHPLDPVPRRFLEAIDSTPYDAPGAGRLALAESILAENNPLAARVIANRVWHHVFGRGLVATPDNFGVMGEAPTHPALLDYLATRMRADGWSMKALIRLLVTSRTFQLSAVAPEPAREQDPTNSLWSHALVRRLEAEAIRDAMLATSGRLNLSAPDRAVGGGSDNRSVYVGVVRNSLDRFLTIFDAPTPVTTTGRRDSTNVPAHALAMLNDPLVRNTAAALAQRATGEDDSSRVSRLFELALGRPPTDAERSQLLAYVASASTRPAGRVQDPELDAELRAIDARLAAIETEIAEHLAGALEKDPELSKEPKDKQVAKAAPKLLEEKRALESQRAPLARWGGPAEPWVELAQSLFSLKEFIYLR